MYRRDQGLYKLLGCISDKKNLGEKFNWSLYIFYWKTSRANKLSKNAQIDDLR